MKNLEDIGARVVHRYYLDNRGQWDLPDVKVNIEWPYQVRPGKEGQKGKWLLYLESEPKILGKIYYNFYFCNVIFNGIVAGGATGFCNVEDVENVVNPLHLELLTSAGDEPENLELPPDFQTDNDTSLRRRRRDVEYIVQAQEVDKGGIKRRVTVMVSNIIVKHLQNIRF